MAEGYTYRGYGIRAGEYQVKGFGTRSGWNICEGEDIVKRNFSTVEIAKHYIDAVLCEAPTCMESQGAPSGEAEAPEAKQTETKT